jgi:hypothetical protein
MIVTTFDVQTKRTCEPMQSMKYIPLIAILFIFSADSTLEAQLLSGSRLRGRIVGRQAVSPVTSGWYPYVIARGEDRTWIRETPIEQRPNRPLHFWGNSRRRVQTSSVVLPGSFVTNGMLPATVDVPVPLTAPVTTPVPPADSKSDKPLPEINR